MLNKPELSLEQQTAVELCCDLTNRIVSVTGGAGTGKTLVLGHVYRELCDSHEIVLAAPTGRAAKRIKELTGIEAKTIHRLLEFPMPDEIDGDTIPGKPKRDGFNPLSQRVIIIDEASMLGPSLYDQLIAACKGQTVLRFFGDNNQLPPVEEGDPPFKTLLVRHNAIELTFNYRSEDAILSNANAILRGKMPQRNERFEIIWSEEPLKELLRFIDSTDFLDTKHQIIMPTRKGKYGTMRINPSLQLRFNGNGPSLRLDRFDEKEAPLVLRAKDKFLWTKNDYQLNIFNGEIGDVEEIDIEDGVVVLNADDRTINVPSRLKIYNPYYGTMISYDPRKQIELGYAITTHKSQGSEFDTVVYCITAGHAWMLGRSNFYTAITRARKQVYLICDRRAMSYSLRKEKVR